MDEKPQEHIDDNAMKEANELLPKVTASDGEKSEKLEIKLQQVFFKDLSNNIPALFEQLTVKDQQIHHLNDTVKVLLNKNDNLEKQLQEADLTYYVNRNKAKTHKKQSIWQELISIPSILLVALIVILVLGLQTFQYWNNKYNANNPVLMGTTTTESDQYLEVIGKYQDKITDLEEEVQQKNEQVNMLYFSLDTLSRAMANISKQLAEKGQKEEEVLRLKEELGQKTLELESLGGIVDSLSYTYVLEKERAEKSRDAEILAETLKKLEEATARRNNGFLGGNLFESTNNFLYFIILLLFILLIFNTLFRRSPAK